MYTVFIHCVSFTTLCFKYGIAKKSNNVQEIFQGVISNDLTFLSTVYNIYQIVPYHTIKLVTSMKKHSAKQNHFSFVTLFLVKSTLKDSSKLIVRHLDQLNVNS